MRRLRQFRDEEEGQDVIEYTLLIAFLTLASLVLVGWGRDPIQGIWTNVNDTITLANTAAN
jgi:Flp pilus assembly pilin Flp